MMETKPTTMNDFFSKLENTRPFVKMAFEGFAGSGKTYTSAQVAIGLHKLIKSEKPIAIFDTERAAKALKGFFEKQGIEVVTRQSRTLVDLQQAIKACQEGVADILIIDSITHVWENYLDQYKTQKKRDNLYFQDWGILKPKWKKGFSDLFVNANLHIIFTGRAGYEYDEIEQQNGKKELVKSGIKMKSENETAYEPDLLVLMERFEDIVGKEKNIWREGTIIKDRTTLIDSKTFRNPTFKDFKTTISELMNGEVSEEEISENPDTFDSKEDDWSQSWSQRKKACDIAIEEIKGSMSILGVSSKTDAGKQFMLKCYDIVFGTASVKKLETLDVSVLKSGAETFTRMKSQYKELKGDTEPFDYENAIDILKGIHESDTLPFE